MTIQELLESILPLNLITYKKSTVLRNYNFPRLTHEELKKSK